MKVSLKPWCVRAAAVALSLCAATALAHHSAAQFDFTQPITIEGTVKQFDVKNPHTHAVLSVTDAKGVRDVSFEGHSASNFYRAGYTRDAVKSGERLAVLVAPRKDGRDGGFILSFKTAQGVVVGFGDLVPASGRQKTP